MVMHGDRMHVILNGEPLEELIVLSTWVASGSRWRM